MVCVHTGGKLIMTAANANVELNLAQAVSRDLRCLVVLLLLLAEAEHTTQRLESAGVEHGLIVLVDELLEPRVRPQCFEIGIRPYNLELVKAGVQCVCESIHARVHLAHGGVAAGDVVLGDAVDLGDAREVVTHVVLGFHGQHVLELNKRLFKLLVGKELEGVVELRFAHSLGLLALLVVAGLQLFGALPVIPPATLRLEAALRVIQLLVLQDVQVTVPLEELEVDLAVAGLDGVDDLPEVAGLPHLVTKGRAHLLDSVTNRDPVV
mmetsp:Transcript_14255/g.43061  ORF Transcript_14255/g.43061 Transcript_14255/m.43061 type:complete len:266 (+) Transcript_14255:1362-2159(+)